MIKLCIRFLGIWADLCHLVQRVVTRSDVYNDMQAIYATSYTSYVILIIIRRRSRALHSMDNSYCVKEKVVKFWVPADIMLHHWAYRVVYIYIKIQWDCKKNIYIYYGWNETSFSDCVSLGCASDIHQFWGNKHNNNIMKWLSVIVPVLCASFFCNIFDRLWKFNSS